MPATPSTRPIPSTTTLERALSRAMALLAAIARYPEIAAALAERGYDTAEHAAGWELVARAGGKDLLLLPGPVTPNAVQDAISALDQWDEPNFRLAAKVLLRSFPDQHAFVFDNLKPATGLESVLAVNTFLDRLDALEAAPDRATTRDADHAALQLLAARGIDAPTRQRLRALGALARTIPLTPEDSAQSERAARAEALTEALADLHYWWDEWAEVARQCITKRRYLLALGLASPVARPTPEPSTPEPAEDTPTDA